MANLGNIVKHGTYFIANKPGVIPRIMSGFFKGVVLRKPVLRTIDWAPTYICNATCKMCSARKLFNPKKKELTHEERKMVWAQAKKLGVIHTQFTGGEPAVKGLDWICQAIRDLDPKNFLVSMTTNASLIDEHWLDEMKAAGLDTIQMSIDSLDPEKQDYFRGLKGNFNHIMKMKDYARSIGLSVCFGTVVWPADMENVWKRVEFTKKHGIFLALNPISSPDNWESKDFDMFQDEQLNDYNKLLEQSHVRADTILNFSGKSGCPSGERIYITAYGDVMSCPHIQISFGNVREEPLETIWKRVVYSPMFEGYKDHCRWAFDKEFYKKYLGKYENRDQKPVSYKEVFGDIKIPE
ncbi:MAG: radical SAM protein [Candidatus Diapherotrites archaeon]|nr:radical SAM protein [Candidatus Micrarchaeota archaeon]MBU1939795.1 radical SAM protein [Candidatus Micrarchaeota archaeon]